MLKDEATRGQLVSTAFETLAAIGRGRKQTASLTAVGSILIPPQSTGYSCVAMSRTTTERVVRHLEKLT